MGSALPLLQFHLNFDLKNLSHFSDPGCQFRIQGKRTSGKTRPKVIQSKARRFEKCPNAKHKKHLKNRSKQIALTSPENLPTKISPNIDPTIDQSPRDPRKLSFWWISKKGFYLHLCKDNLGFKKFRLPCKGAASLKIPLVKTRRSTCWKIGVLQQAPPPQKKGQESQSEWL